MLEKGKRKPQQRVEDVRRVIPKPGRVVLRLLSTLFLDQSVRRRLQVPRDGWSRSWAVRYSSFP